MKRRIFAAFSLAAGLVAWPMWAAIESGVYQTLPGATVEERGDRVPNESRIVPVSATVSFHLDAAEPSFVASIPNAVLEGGEPFALTVRDSSPTQQETNRFMGDYLKDIHPSGTQYLFDWRFSPSTNGEVVWNGITYWAGGHIWLVTISNVVLVPVPRLEMARSGGEVIVSWPEAFPGYQLEQAASLPALEWRSVTNATVMAAGRFSVTIGPGSERRFFRLRKF